MLGSIQGRPHQPGAVTEAKRTRQGGSNGSGSSPLPGSARSLISPRSRHCAAKITEETNTPPPNPHLAVCQANHRRHACAETTAALAQTEISRRLTSPGTCVVSEPSHISLGRCVFSPNSHATSLAFIHFWSVCVCVFFFFIPPWAFFWSTSFRLLQRS